jgi:tRNA modification GTPase
VELEGIRKTRQVIESADVVAYLVDGSRGLEPEDRPAMELIGEERLVAVWSKADLAAASPPAGFTSCSGRTGSGLEDLHAAILSRLSAEGPIEADSAVIDSMRQKQLIERCREALDRAASALAASHPPELVAVDVREALDALGEITGEVTSADVIDAMFSAFCVGK